MKEEYIDCFINNSGKQVYDGSLVVSYAKEKNFIIVNKFFCKARGKDNLININAALTVLIRLVERLSLSHGDEEEIEIVKEFVKKLEVLQKMKENKCDE